MLTALNLKLLKSMKLARIIYHSDLSLCNFIILLIRMKLDFLRSHNTRLHIDVKRVNQSIQTNCVLSIPYIHVINVVVSKHGGFSNSF